MGIGERIRFARETADMTQEDLGRICGTTKQTIFKYEAGIVTNIPLDRLERIAAALNVSPAYLMGWDDLPANVVRMPQLRQVPKVGDIACGTPILAEQNITDYVDLPDHIRADYALTCHGDSMIGAGIHEGDIVYILAEADVQDGQIAAVLIGEEATLKHLYRDASGVTLVADNPAYPPKHFGNEDGLRVLGKAVAFTHAL